MKNLNQSTGLKAGRMENGILHVYPDEKVQEVMVHTNRKGLTGIINTILKNVGVTRRISSKDNFERILSVWEYLYANLNVNLSHLIKWEECKDENLLRQKNYLLSLDYPEVFIQEIKRVKKNDYFINLFIFSENKKFWWEIVKHYSKTEWIINFNQVGSGPIKNIQCGSQIFFLENERLAYITCESDDYDAMESIFPVYFGLKKNFILMNEIKSDEKRLQDSVESDYPLDVKWLDKNITMNSPQEYIDLIQNKIRMFNINQFKWKGLVSVLKQNPQQVSIIDGFSPYFFDVLEEDKRKII